MGKTLEKVIKKNDKVRYEIYFLVPFVISQLIMMALPIFTNWFQNIFLTAILPMWITAGVIIWIINSNEIYAENKKWGVMAALSVCFVVCLSDGAIGLLSTIGVISTMLGLLTVLVVWLSRKAEDKAKRKTKK